MNHVSTPPPRPFLSRCRPYAHTNKIKTPTRIEKIGGESTAQQDASRRTELVAEQGAGTLVRRLVEAAARSAETTLYDCAVVVHNLAGSAVNSAALQRDLVGVGEGGVLPALEKLGTVRWVSRVMCYFTTAAT